MPNPEQNKWEEEFNRRNITFSLDATQVSILNDIFEKLRSQTRQQVITEVENLIAAERLIATKKTSRHQD